MGCDCGKPKCDGHCGISPAVLQINNPSECVLFHRVEVPASMGDSKTNPPKPGAYKNVLLYYEADQTSWLYSSDGMPTPVNGEQGPTGAQGPAGTITIGTTTTGATGEDASVENVGTPENAILNFTIPRGEQGEQGIQGETGPQGYMNEQDVRDAVDTIIPEGFFDDEATVSDCGTEFELDGVSNGHVESLEMKGNTSQSSYSGHNILNFTPGATSQGVTTTANGDGTITVTGTTTASWANLCARSATVSFPAGTYTLSRTVASNFRVEIRAYTQETGGTYTDHAIAVGTTSTTFTVNSDIKSGYLFLSGMTTGRQLDETFGVQLVAGTAEESFEPYVGGIPAPNPSYPQPIETVTERQTVTVAGKNLFDKDSVTAGIALAQDGSTVTNANWSVSDYIPVVAGNSYTLSGMLITPASVRNVFYDENKTFVASVTRPEGSTTYTAPSGSHYMRICVYNYVSGGGAVVNESPVAMLEVGSQASAYEPYEATSYPVSLGDIELCKIGNYQDYIYKGGSGWILHKATGTIEFGGSTPWSKHSSTGGNIFMLDDTGFVGYAYNTGLVAPALMDTDIASALGSNGGVSDNAYGRFGITGTGQLRVFRGDYDSDYTANVFKSEMAGHRIIGALTTPIETAITDTELINQLENIRVRNGGNTIILSSDGIIGELCVDAYADNWNGTIANLSEEISDLNRLASKEYLGRSKYLNLKRIMREIRINSRNPAYSSSDYPGMQGGIYIGDNLFIQASPRGEDVQLKEINLSTGAEVRSTVLALQHANSLAYNPVLNEVYVTSLTLNSVYTHYVYVLDYTTLTIKRTLELDLGANEGTHSISYDNVTEKTYIGVETKSVNTFDLYELDVVTGDITAVELINYKSMLGSGGATNDMCIANSKMYLLKHAPAVLAIFDLATGECDSVLNVPTYTESGFGTGEVESVSYDYSTGDLIIAGFKSDCKNGWVNLFNYFRTNLAQGINSNQNADLSNNPLKTVYVDVASTSINPMGGSWSDAFKTIGEALERLNDERVKSLEIFVKEGTYPYFYVNTSKSVAVRGADAGNRENQIIQGVGIERCCNFFMSAVTINRPDGDYDADIALSHAFITSTAFRGTHDEHIHVYFSQLEFFNLPCETTLFRTQAENMLISNDSIPNYKIAGSLPAVNKPVEIATFNNMSNTAISVDYTGREPFIETSNARLSFLTYGYYGLDKTTFPTQTVDGGNRNFCVTLDSKIITIQVVFNSTDKTLSARITKAIDLKNGAVEDITSSATLDYGKLYFEY